MSKPDFWKDREEAKTKNQRVKELKEKAETWKELSKEVEDLLEIALLDKEAKDVNLRNEIEKKLKKLKRQFEQLEFFAFLKGKYDQRNAILSIHAGAGGVDAQDWVEMLKRMYERFSQRRKWRIKVIDESRGSEAGIKSLTLEIRGFYAYGYLKGEAGVHRLVRISPFDAERMRHTSFVLVEILPEMEEEKIEIKPKDLRIDTFLSSGPGGQGVQTTYSAVRVVHLPTKITVTCQAERSQLQNKEQALKILKSKLIQYNLAQEEKEKARLRGQYQPAEWGHQIRSYVLHPYKIVKDHRTNYETDDVEAVLNGEIEGFIENYLKKFKDNP